MSYKLWDILNEMKTEYEWVELSHSLNNDSPYWGGIPEGSVELGKVCYDWGNPMLECIIHTFKFPGQFGTHIDFPAHFIKEGKTSEYLYDEHALDKMLKERGIKSLSLSDKTKSKTKSGDELLTLLQNMATYYRAYNNPILNIYS